jgi:hypothetical protein
MKVLTSAITTIIEKSAGERSPRSSPMSTRGRPRRIPGASASSPGVLNRETAQ